MEKITFEAGWKFENSYESLPPTFFSKVSPTKVRNPNVVVLNNEFAKSLGLSIDTLSRGSVVQILAGNQIPEGASPIAQAYAGHQFGHFTMLGDGRAILLGEHITNSGERFDIQLKGAGVTPYSRMGDGRAVLGPMLREYIISEAMHGLGIPTTRSLAVVTTGEQVPRESEDRGAILTRVASSHIRVGTFEYAKNFGTKEELKSLADYTIARHYPGVLKEKNPYPYFYREVIHKQANLIAKWQLVGFVHGVMNTDNMTISGETIDYGPCAFMDTYDVNTVFSSIDRSGRYAYGNQPRIAAWNLARLGESLLRLFHEDMDEALRIANDELSMFQSVYKAFMLDGMRKKLGLFEKKDQDENLIQSLLEIMQTLEMDYTNTFVDLTFETLTSEIYQNEVFKEWYQKYQERRNHQEESMKKIHQLMKNHNPAVIARNHRVEEALSAAVRNQDYTLLHQLLNALKHPYAHLPEQAEYRTLSNDNCRYRTYCGT